MGYLYQAIEINMPRVTFESPITLNQWEAFSSTDHFYEIESFIFINPRIIRKGNDKFVVGLSFSTSDSENKNYYLDKALESMNKDFFEFTGKYITGDFILLGEDYGDVSKYVFNSDGTVSIHQGRPTYAFD